MSLRIATLSHQADARGGTVALGLLESGAVIEERWLNAGGPVPDLDAVDGLLALGSYDNVDDGHPWLDVERALLREALDRELPVLAICLGAQLLAQAAGAWAGPLDVPELGWLPMEVDPELADDPLLGGLGLADGPAVIWHGYHAELPPGAVRLARTNASLQAYRVGPCAWGTQFHPEVAREDFDLWTRPGGLIERTTVDAAAVRARSVREMPRWNALGRALGHRFAQVVRERAAADAARPPR